MPEKAVLDETTTARRFAAKITLRGVLRGKMLIALMATSMSE